MNKYISQIQKTASTLFELRDHSEVAYAQQIADLMAKKTGIAWPKVYANNFSALPVSRFHTNQNVLDFFAGKFGAKLQIVELGAGFTPHYLNLNTKILKYVEVEHENNSKLKQEIIGEINPLTSNLVFVPGDILEAGTWDRVKENLDMNHPVIVFSEGVIAQYFDDEQKKTVAGFVKDLLKVDGSAFIIDDTLRNHPELHDNPVIRDGMRRIAQNSGNSVYNAEFQTFDGEVRRWEALLPDKKIVTVEYVKSKPEMDFAIGRFKLIVCLQDAQSNLEPALVEASGRNKIGRVWK